MKSSRYARLFRRIAHAGYVAAAMTLVFSFILTGIVQPALANGLGNCGSGWVYKDENSPFTYSGDQIITSVYIKAGSQNQEEGACTLFTSNGTDNCYSVSGLGTNQVIVTKVGNGKDCKDISHVEFYAAKGTSTPTVTEIPPSVTPSFTPTNTKVPPTVTPSVTPTDTEIPPTVTPSFTLTDTPQTPTDTPVVPTHTPVTPTDTPETPTDTPESPTDTPSAPAETPVNTPTEIPPQDPTETPVYPTSTPIPPSNGTPTEVPDPTRTPVDPPTSTATDVPEPTSTPTGPEPTATPGITVVPPEPSPTDPGEEEPTATPPEPTDPGEPEPTSTFTPIPPLPPQESSPTPDLVNPPATYAPPERKPRTPRPGNEDPQIAIIPVTGAEVISPVNLMAGLGQVNPQNFFNLGLTILGLAMVSHGLSKRFDRD